MSNKWRTGEREGDVPTQPSGSGEDAPDIYIIIFLLCIIGGCVICAATAAGG